MILDRMTKESFMFQLTRRLGLAALCVAALIGTSTTSAQAAPTPQPYLAINRDFPDPSILHADGRYWMYATNSGGVNLPVASAATPYGEWTVIGEGMPTLGAWARTGFTWAPDVSRLDDGSYIDYYTARDVASGRQCVGAAKADNPAGPFAPVGDQPMFCPVDQGGAIDASGFTDSDGTRYVSWKNDGNAIGVPTHLYIQKVAADGVTTIGDPVIALTNDPATEGSLVEAPYLIKHHDRYFLFYSYGAYNNENYTEAYASAPSIDGPWTRGDQPLMSTANMRGAVVGPGGASILGDLVAFHAVTHRPGLVRPAYLINLKWQGMTPTVTAR
jgi:arabinan endo-1,5-alpha-L-arabinosidase